MRQVHITDASIKAVSDLFRKEGSDAWYKYDANDILPKTEVCECGASDWEKDPDIMDVLVRLRLHLERCLP